MTIRHSGLFFGPPCILVRRCTYAHRYNGVDYTELDCRASRFYTFGCPNSTRNLQSPFSIDSRQRSYSSSEMISVSSNSHPLTASVFFFIVQQMHGDNMRKFDVLTAVDRCRVRQTDAHVHDGICEIVLESPQLLS